MDPQQIQKLANILRDQGDKLLTSEFKFTLTGDLLRSLNDSFSLIIDENELVVPTMTFQVTKPNNSKSNVFRELNFIYDFLQKTLILKLTKFLDDDPLEDDNCVIDISKFRNLTILEIQRVPIQRIMGLHRLRSQLQEIKAERSLTSVKDLIMSCAGDKSNGFIWNSLKRADFSYNNLEKIDSSFEFTPYLQHLNLSHNKFVSINLAWLPNLKVINLSYNQLTTIPKLNLESHRRLRVLILNDNLIDDVSGLVRLENLVELDLSGNCLLDHSHLLPICTCTALQFLNLTGNPLAFHPKHRSATCRYLSKNAATVQFQLDNSYLSKHEKQLTGSYENYYPIFGHRMTVSTSSSRATPSTKSISNTPDNSSLGSANSLVQQSNLAQQTSASNQKRMKPRCVEIEESGSHHKQQTDKSPKQRRLLKEGSKEHLVTKREIEQLREQFGNEWLFNQGNVVGFEEQQNAMERKKLEYGDLLSSSPAMKMDESFDNSDRMETSTPLDDTMIPNDGTLYSSANDSTGNSVYASALDETFNAEVEEEVVVSEPEENEVQFIGTNEVTKEELFIVVSEVNIKEKDAMNGRTFAKWGLSTLESVERIRSSLIKLTFDTIRKDKRERQYRMETKCCQELERILRDYLSTRPLSEMNQAVFKCLRCNSQFSREIDERKKRDYEIKCSCGSKFVTEIQKTNKCETSPPKTSFLTGNISTPATTSTASMAKTASSISIEKKSDNTGTSTVPKTSHSFSSIESAFDSNQSVAGSSVEILSECSSQASHVSHASQSSIEVLLRDSNYGSRKPSEERRFAQIPPLATIQDATPKNEEHILDDTLTSSVMKKSDELVKPKVILSIGNVNLTESSSSGSICESVVTAYDSRKNEKASSEEKSPETKLEGIFKSSQNLLKKTPKVKKESTSYGFTPIQYNYDDLSIVDHRLKLYLFQKVLEENEEKLMWLVKSLVIEDDSSSSGIPVYALLIMSTKKFYVLKILAEESEDIGSWLKKSTACAIDSIEAIRDIFGNTGFSFVLGTKTNVHVLLNNQNVTDCLRKHIMTSNQTLEIENSLPKSSMEKLMKLTQQNELKSLAIFHSCKTSIGSSISSDTDTSEDQPKISVGYGAILVTTEAIILTTNFQWLCDNINDKMFCNDVNVTLTQPMNNLVELEDVTKSTFTLSFLDELENTIEKWKFVFESSYPRIVATLETIDSIWQKIFSVPLINDDLTLG